MLLLMLPEHGYLTLVIRLRVSYRETRHLSRALWIVELGPGARRHSQPTLRR